MAGLAEEIETDLLEMGSDGLKFGLADRSFESVMRSVRYVAIPFLVEALVVQDNI